MLQIAPEQLAELDSDFSASQVVASLQWQSVGRSDIGNVRPVNEDAFFNSDPEGLWAVADGMGGLSRGDYASAAVIKACKQFSRQDSLAANIEALESSFKAVNETCRTAFRGKRLGTTVAALLAFGNHCFCLWAGDSRIYRLRDGQLEQSTEDHCLLQEELKRQSLEGDSKGRHNQASAHILTRAVGVHRQLKLDLRYAAARAGDRYLLCSDGLYNCVEPEDIRSLLGQGSTENALNCLIDTALRQGGQDNITAVIVEARSGSE